MLKSKTKKFLEDFQSSNFKTNEDIEKFERFLDENPEVLLDLYNDVKVKNFRISEDLKDSVKKFKDPKIIFSEFLGKYKIEELIKFGIECLNKQLDYSTFSGEILDKIDKIPSLVDNFSKKLPKLSNFTFSDDLPTVDLKKSIEQNTKNFIDSQIQNFVNSTISILFNNILNCSDDYKVPSVNVDKVQKELIDKYGLEHSNISNFLTDLTQVLTTSELCQLIKEENNDDTFQIIQLLLENKHINLKNIFRNKESIFDLFTILKSSFNSNFCNDILESNINFGNCKDSNVSEIRRCLLEKNVDKEKIKNLLDNLKNKRNQNFEKLLELLERVENEKIDISNFCKVSQDEKFLSDLSEEYSKNIELFIGSILETIKTSYDQNIRTFKDRMLKSVEFKSEDELLPNFYHSIISEVEKDYNKQFSNTISKFSDNSKDLKDVIENSAKGMKNLNDFMNFENVKMLSNSGFTSRKKKKVQPELMEKLKSSNFYNINILDNSISFKFPKREEENIGDLFKNKLYSANTPNKVDDFMNFQFWAEKNENNEIIDNTTFNFSTTETRIKVDSFLEKEKNCQTVKVYLPLNFGLLEYPELYETVNNSQPIFPDYGSVFDQYYREFTKINVIFQNQNIQTLGKKIVQRLEAEHLKRLQNVDKKRFFPYILSEISTLKSYNVPNFLISLSEMEILYDYYDDFGLRKNLDQSFVQLIPGILEKFFLENVWKNLRVAYYYRIHKSGECYLTKIDLNEKIFSGISDDQRYGGPKMNVEDWFSYNQLNIGQNSWNSNNLWFDLQNIPILKLNPFRTFAGLKIPHYLSHQSNIPETSIFKGKIEFKYGIPANRKSRENSWFKSENSIKVDNFGNSNYILPSYFGDLVKFEDSKVLKEEAFKGKSKNVKYTKDNLTGINFLRDRNSNILIEKSSIPEDINVPEQFRIKNILDLGEEPLKILKNQGKTWFPENKSEVEQYRFPRESKNYKISKVLSSDNVPKKYFEGYNPNNVGKIISSNTSISSNIGNNNKINPNLYSNFWYHIILESLEKFMVLDDLEKSKIRDLYLKEDSYVKLMTSILDKISNYVSLSPLFSSVEVTNQNPRQFSVDDVEGEKSKGVLETNILELVNFTPSSSLCGVDNGILRINELKRKLLEDFKNINRCLDSDERKYKIKVILSILKIMIRVYSVEFVLFSIFFFSRFDLLENEISDVLVEIVYDKIINNLQNINKVQILEVSKEIYNSEFKNLKDLNCEDSLKFLIRVNIRNSSEKLKEILYDLNSIKSNNFSLFGILKESFIPFVELPKSDFLYRQQGGRFITSESGKKSNLENKELLKRFTNFEDIKDLSTKYNVEKPGFYFEKYVVADYKQNVNEKILEGSSNLERFEEYLNTLKFSQDDKFSKFFNDLKVGIRLCYRPTSNEFQGLKPIVYKRQQDLNYKTKTLYEPGTNQIVPEFYILQQTISGKFILPISNVFSEKNIKVQLFWKVNTLEDEKFVRDMLMTDNWDTSRLTENNEKNFKVFVDLEGTFKGSLEDFSKTFKIYKDGKFYDNSQVVDFIDTQIFKSGNIRKFRRGTLLGPISSKTTRNEVIGESILIPILEKVITLDIENIKFSDISNIETFKELENSELCENIENLKFVEKNITKLEFVKNFETCYFEKLMNMITSDEKYKLIFQNIFNIPKIASMVILYIYQYNRITTNIDGMFDTTKINISNFVKNLNSGNDLRVQTLEPQQDLFDVESIRNSTPFILLKGLMETFDPNISVSKKVSTVVNSYRREILNSTKEYLKIVEKPEKTLEELEILDKNSQLISVAQEIEKLPELPISIPSLFFMISGIIPSPLGFSYLGFEELFNSELFEKFQSSLKLQEKVKSESGINLDEQKYC